MADNDKVTIVDIDLNSKPHILIKSYDESVLVFSIDKAKEIRDKLTTTIRRAELRSKPAPGIERVKKD